MRMAKRTRRCNCSVTRWRWQSRAASSVIFVDEGLPMAQLLSEAAAPGMMPDYIGKLLAAFEAEEQKSEDTSYSASTCPASYRAIEPTRVRSPATHCPRTLESEISERLFLALNTVKGHNRNIFGKLQVQRRTEAVARARELGLL